MSAKTKSKSRTKPASSVKGKKVRRKGALTQPQELDSVYFLKIVLYLILGSLWLKITVGGTTQIPIPVGLIFGLLFASHEHFQIDRKVEMAVLLIAMLVGFWAPIGLFLNL